MTTRNQALDALPPLQHVQHDGRRIAFRETGDGAALLLLHGVGSGSASWRAQFQGLASRFRLIAWDAPGYGESDGLPDAAPAAADYAAAALALADGLGLARFHLLGHSLGAIIAAALCRRNPDKVASLILTDPATGHGAAPAADRAARLAARLDAMATLGPAGLADKRAAALLSPTASAAAVAQVRAVMAGLRPDGYAQACRMLAAADIMVDAPAISRPTLVLCGSADTVTPEAGCRRIAASIPQARYETLPGVGHASYVENPVQFDAALISFLVGLQ